MRVRRCAVSVLVIGAVFASTQLATAGTAEDLRTAKQASLKYRDVARAIDDGYIQQGECTALGGRAMGIHYTKQSLVDDGAFNPATPEQLLYVPHPSGKGLRLVGVEYRKDDADQNLATTDDRPTGFGRPFDGPMAGHFPGDPTHYDLHVWVHARNPEGMFEAFNPAVSCNLAFDSVRVARSLSAAAAVSRGIPIRIGVGVAGTRFDAVARLARQRTVIGRGRKTARREGPTRLVIRPTLRGVRTVDRILQRRRSVAVDLELTARQPGGQREKRKRRVRLRR
jgi:hypothetical protein